ncbi:MAG: ABC transporter ATP-binding protein [Alphaproteobacteria bacterium]|nr:ABC transporter ATP-binding protein [Alphaproteobacteria bacterium]
MNETADAICVTNLHYRYHDGMEALRGLSLNIKQGETVCLAGANGAGKSTLLLCLAGLLNGQGSVAVGNGVTSSTRIFLPDPSVFGLVFQDPEDQLFCPTVGEDVAFGPRNMKCGEPEVAARVANALSAAGLSGFEQRSAHHMSGGEKKRAAIAAVLACQPAILALDEPWANLDARAARSVTAFLRGYQGTLIVASQDLYHAAEVCSRLVVVDKGSVASDGPMNDLLHDAALLEAHGLEFGMRCRACRHNAERVEKI